MATFGFSGATGGTTIDEVDAIVRVRGSNSVVKRGGGRGGDGSKGEADVYRKRALRDNLSSDMNAIEVLVGCSNRDLVQTVSLNCTKRCMGSYILCPTPRLCTMHYRHYRRGENGFPLCNNNML